MNRNLDESLEDKEYSYFKEKSEFFTESNPDLKLRPYHFSAASINSFIDFNSSSRGIMSSSQVSQALVLNNPTPSTIQNNTMYELGKYTIAKKIEDKVEVLSVLKRRLNYKTKIIDRIIVFRNLETGIIDCMELPMFNRLHNYFGFEYNLDDRVDNFNRGDIIVKDTILAKSNNVDDNGLHSIGRDVNVALMSLEEADEDGFIVSDTFLKDFSFSMFETYTLEAGENSYFLNVNGDIDNYKPIPDIGDKIKKNGLVMASRNYDDEYGPALYSKKASMNANPIFDNCVYGRNFDGTVIDIKVYKNSKRKKSLPIGTEGMLNEYANSLISFYKQLIDVYETLNSEYRNMHGTDLTVGNTFNVLLVEAYGIYDSENPSNKLKKMHRKEILDLYKVQVTVKYHVTLNKGFKPTDLSGNV